MVCLDKKQFWEEKSGFVWTNFITFIAVCEYCYNRCFYFKQYSLWEDRNDYIHYDAIACILEVKLIIPNSTLFNLNILGTVK